jgi:hypothetical protein
MKQRNNVTLKQSLKKNVPDEAPTVRMKLQNISVGEASKLLNE